MKQIKTKNMLPRLVLTLIVFSGMVVFAANNETVSRALNFARPEVKVQVGATVKRGGETFAADKVEMVKSGEMLDWKISSANEGNGDAQNYRVVGQIPAGTSFVAGSGKGDNSPKVTYSIDGGKSFSEQPMINQKAADGTIKQVPAPADMFTQVRFEWAASLPAQGSFNAAYSTRVR